MIPEEVFAKTKVTATQGNPLPIPIKGFINIPLSPWPCYSAEIFCGHIIVKDPAHAKALYHNGYFGQGMLSTKGFQYETESKRITQSQLKRKLEWRELYFEKSKPHGGGTSTKAPGKCIPKKYVYVVPDVDFSTPSDVEDDQQQQNQERHCQQVVEEEEILTLDPFAMDEHLILYPEEAMFLCYGLGCLVVSDEEGKKLNVDELWKVLLLEDSDLLYRYLAYHVMRSDGWVVRDGARYGADYLLYTIGAPFYHSQHLVRVEGRQLPSKKLMTRNALTAGEADAYHRFNSSDRVAASVQKISMLCLVLRPPSLTDVTNIEECISKLRVEQLPYQMIESEDSAIPSSQETS